MANQKIFQDLKKFIREQSIGYLVLKFCSYCIEHNLDHFTAEEVASELGIGIDVAQEQLLALASADLVVAPDWVSSIYSYYPRTMKWGSGP